LSASEIKCTEENILTKEKEVTGRWRNVNNEELKDL
jgi:hypothetical protein